MKSMTEQARILVVDDDVAVRNSFAAVLRNEGYSVDSAETGNEAINKAKTSFYNLALIDIRLPDMQGTELLTAIKDTVPPMIKIIVTGYATLENAVRAVNNGADGYLMKPTNIDDLLNSIKQQLKKQQEATSYSQDKLTEFIDSRAKKLDADRDH